MEDRTQVSEHKIQTVFFDIGNVLIHFSYEQMHRQVGDVCGLSPEEVHAHLLKEDLGIQYEKGEVTTDEMCAYFLRIGSKPHTQEELLRAMSEIFYPNEAIYPIVQSLKEQGFRLILLSNTCEAHFAYIQREYPILDCFDGRALSYEVKARKPERKIFEKALSLAGCSAGQCFYTDDMPEYIKAARSLGIDAEPYKDATTLMAHLQLRGIAAN